MQNPSGQKGPYIIIGRSNAGLGTDILPSSRVFTYVLDVEAKTILGLVDL